MIITNFARLQINDQRLYVCNGTIGVIPQVSQIKSSGRRIRVGKRQGMFPKCRVIRGERGATGTFILARSRNKDTEIFFVEEQIIAIDKRLAAFQWKPLTWFEFHFTRSVRSKDIPLMQPK